MREFKQSVTGESNRADSNAAAARPAAGAAAAGSAAAPPAQPAQRPPRRRAAGRAPVAAGAAGARRQHARPVAPTPQRLCRIGPVCDRLEGRAGDLLELSRSSSFQPASGAPVMYHDEPLSATISP